MPRWRRFVGILSVPPVAHPRRAVKPSAVTTVGAGLVPALSHPKIGPHPIPRVHTKMGADSRMPPVANRPRSVRVTLSSITDGVTHSSLLFTLSSHLGGRAFGPPLCGGIPPATPPIHHATLAPCSRHAVCTTGRPPTSCREAVRRDHRRVRPCACPVPANQWTANNFSHCRHKFPT